jgi:chromosome partitioning protein
VIITIANFKGGVGKTTSAVHLAGVLAASAPTLLIDQDRHPGALKWSRKGGFEFHAVTGADATPALVRDYRLKGNVVIDTPAAPTPEDLIAFGGASNVVLVPTTGDALAVEALVDTVRDLRRANVPFRIALVKVPPPPSREGERAREAFAEAGLPVLATEVPRAAAFHHAALAGVLVRDLKREPRAASLWALYQQIADELRAAVGGTP